MLNPVQIISDDAEVARCVIYPRYWKDKDSPFDPHQMLDFKRQKPGFDFKTSVGGKDKLSSVEDVHSYGCRSAAVSNTNSLAKGKLLVPLENQAHYVGHYLISVADAKKQANEAYDIYVEIVPENGEEAHCHVVLAERADLSKDLQKEKAFHRTNIFTGIWELMRGPERFVCHVDEAFRKELDSVGLPPGGTPIASV